MSNAEHVTKVDDETYFADNQAKDCLSVFQRDYVSGEYDTIHICDWEAFKDAGDRHQSERGA
jgi:hypothetical protein